MPPDDPATHRALAALVPIRRPLPPIRFPVSILGPYPATRRAVLPRPARASTPDHRHAADRAGSLSHGRASRRREAASTGESAPRETRRVDSPLETRHKKTGSRSPFDPLDGDAARFAARLDVGRLCACLGLGVLAVVVAAHRVGGGVLAEVSDSRAPSFSGDGSPGSSHNRGLRRSFGLRRGVADADVGERS